MWFVLLACLGSARAHAQPHSETQREEETEEWTEKEFTGPEIVTKHNKGWRFSLSPGLLVPVRGGPITFAFGADLRYGFELGPVVLAPGLRFGARLLAKPHVYMSYATLRLTVPLGSVGPYVLAGIGGGWIGEPAFAYLAGGGFMVHVGTRFGVGAEATLQSLIYSSFKVVAVGPQFLIEF